MTVKTLEQLAGWLLFSLSILMVYGLLSLFLIGPTHASNDIPGPAPFGWIDSLDMSEQPTFAQMDRGVDAAETTDDSHSPTDNGHRVCDIGFVYSPSTSDCVPTPTPMGQGCEAPDAAEQMDGCGS